MKRRLLAFFIILCMGTAYIPFQIIAYGAQPGAAGTVMQVENADDFVAALGGRAIKNQAASGSAITITMTENISSNLLITEGDYILNMNGHTINGRLILGNYYGNPALHITGNGTVDNTQTGGNAISQQSGSLSIENGTFMGKNGSGGSAGLAVSRGSAVISGGNYSGYFGLYVDGDADVVVKGGIFTGDGYGCKGNSSMNGLKLSVTGGNFFGNLCSFGWSDGELTLSGGLFLSSGYSWANSFLSTGTGKKLRNYMMPGKNAYDYNMADSAAGAPLPWNLLNSDSLTDAFLIGESGAGTGHFIQGGFSGTGAINKQEADIIFTDNGNSTKEYKVSADHNGNFTIELPEGSYTVKVTGQDGSNWANVGKVTVKSDGTIEDGTTSKITFQAGGSGGSGNGGSGGGGNNGGSGGGGNNGSGGSGNGGSGGGGNGGSGGGGNGGSGEGGNNGGSGGSGNGGSGGGGNGGSGGSGSNGSGGSGNGGSGGSGSSGSGGSAHKESGKNEMNAEGFGKPEEKKEANGTEGMDGEKGQEPGTTLEGMVKDIRGQGIEGAYVIVKSKDGNGREYALKSGENGQFQINGILDGVYWLTVSAGDGMENTGIIMVKDGIITGDFLVILIEKKQEGQSNSSSGESQTGTKITGKVTDANGSGKGNSQVAVAGSGEWEERDIKTEANGGFVLPELPDGTYQIKVTNHNGMNNNGILEIENSMVKNSTLYVDGILFASVSQAGQDVPDGSGISEGSSGETEQEADRMENEEKAISGKTNKDKDLEGRRLVVINGSSNKKYAGERAEASKRSYGKTTVPVTGEYAPMIPFLFIGAFAMMLRSILYRQEGQGLVNGVFRKLKHEL